jgi:ectoine hydroxylase-related dioxygenase (phytanoyl-CoA dioxygenase family)
MRPPIPLLTQDQIVFFQDKGYLAIDAIATPDEVELMRAAYDRLFAEEAGWDSGDRFDLAGTDEKDAPAALPQLLNPARYAPEFETLACRERALAMARQLLGETAHSQGDHAILKPAGMGAATPWHQDEAYWNPELAYRALSVWIPLQEATPQNGCMHFLPGSHQGEVLAHHAINHDPRIHGLEVDVAVDMRQAVACPLPAGGATFHHARTLHYTGENRTDQPRRAYIMMFGTPPEPSPAPRQFPWIGMRQTSRMERAGQAAKEDYPK